jgi:gp16 family phage-associated protein
MPIVDQERPVPPAQAVRSHGKNLPRLSAEQKIWRRFRNEGVNVRAWAISRGFNPGLVYSILRGERKCIRGQSHDVAVALGLKATTLD